jgi:serine protease Do
MSLAEIERAAQAAIDGAGRSVVRIGRDGRGSGIVVGDGLVLTNAHNLRGAETTVTFGDGRSAVATVAGSDLDGDLAVLQVDTTGAPAIPWRDAEAPAVRSGTAVFALAGGPSGPRVSFGLVRTVAQAFRGPRGRRITGGVEHTAPLPRGASGGPVLDVDGRLLAVNTHRIGEGVYLSMPADAALRARVDALAVGRAPTRRRLGVALAPAEVARRLRRSVGLPDATGLLVREVMAGSPAEAAGLREGDLLTAAGGRELATTDDLHEALDAVAEGEALVVSVLRGNEGVSATVRFDAPAAEAATGEAAEPSEPA